MSFNAGDPVLVTFRARWQAQDAQWLRVSISQQQGQITIPMTDVEELEEALPEEPEWEPRDVVVDDGGVTFQRTNDKGWHAFNGQWYAHQYPRRPLIPLSRDGKPWE